MLRLKLALIFVGAPLALASRPLEARWLFFVGLALLIVALAIPAAPGQTPKARLRHLRRYLPGLRWLHRRD